MPRRATSRGRRAIVVAGVVAACAAAVTLGGGPAAALPAAQAVRGAAGSYVESCAPGAADDSSCSGVIPASPAGFAAPAGAPPGYPVAAPAGPPIQVNVVGDTGDANVPDLNCDSDNTTPGNQCTLRAAIMTANAAPGADTITFAIGTGPKTIVIGGLLPTITDPVVIDGTTQPGFTGTPIIELNGNNGPETGLLITAGNSTVRGLVINRFGGSATVAAGIALEYGGNNVIEGNFIGTDVGGTLARGNGGNGIYVSSSNNRIGGTAAAQRNVISGNLFPGVIITADLAAADANVVEGNYIGTDLTGTAPLGNWNVGVLIRNGALNIVGGTTGVSPAACWGSCNIISNSIRKYASDGYGIVLHQAGASSNLVEGNYIGTDITGTVAFPNVADGIRIDTAAGNTIGGTAADSRNLIAANGGDGIDIRGTQTAGNTIEGNYIGVDVSGTLALPNTENGVYINNTPGSTIGGTAGARNVISGNGGAGVKIEGASATGNVLQSNLIGLQQDGITARKNASHGVYITTSAANTMIGATAPGLGNHIAFNGGDGVYIDSGTGNAIHQNEIFSNDGLGIDLGVNGENMNDALDADTGANNLQNTPTITAAPPNIPTTTVSGFLNAAANTTYTLEFYSNKHGDPSPLGEGRYYVGSTLASTDGAGHAAFTFTTSSPVLPGEFVTATATDPSGNTSEFSHDADYDGLFDNWETTGIDFDMDGTVDLTLAGANPMHKDLYVEVDAMVGRPLWTSVKDRVIAAFAAAPNGLVNNPDLADGVALHIEVDETNITQADLPGPWAEFNAIKQNIFPAVAGGFGTVAQRGAPSSSKILGAKRLAYRYAIIGDTMRGGGTSGIAELGGNDFLVTLGAWTVPGGTRDQQAGTFMHEFGHTLGLYHGGNQEDVGPDGVANSGDENYSRYNFKPNYHSLMNYDWQTPKPEFTGWTLDYSREAFPDLNEANLNENTGIGGHPGHKVVVGPLAGTRTVDESGPVDWSNVTDAPAGHDKDGDGIVNDDTGVAADINVIRDGLPASPGDILTGYEDWSHLLYSFRESPDFADGVNTTYQRDEEPVTDFISNEMRVSGNSAVIEDGAAAANVPDGTDFGNAQIGGGAVTQTFTVENLGNYPLNLTGTPVVHITGPAAGEFSVALQPASALAAYGGTTTFQVTFSPTSLGLRQATIVIASDDGDANPYDFAVAGTGIAQVDTDHDGCSDLKELLLAPPTDPNNAWDFYSVPVPALFAAPNPLVVFRDSIIGASDAQAVFGYFTKAARTGSVEYEQDLNANGVKDGLEYDRSTIAGSPGVSGPPNGVISAADAQLAFAQFGRKYKC